MNPMLTLRRYNHDLLAHSHDHAQLVFPTGSLEFEVGGIGARVERQNLAVVPPGEHHACGSPRGSLCLVLDVPDDTWLQRTLGGHFDASRRLLENPVPCSSTPPRASWWAGSPPARSTIR